MKHSTLPRWILPALLGFTPAATAQTLVAHYRLDETSGPVCLDSSPNQLHGTYENVTVYGQPSSSQGCGTSVEFDDTLFADVALNNTAPFDTLTQNITVSAWINPDVIPGANAVQRIFGNDNGGWTCGLRGDGLIFTTRFIQDYLFNGVPITPNAWNHVAFVFDANFDVTVYVGGVAMGTVTGSSPSNFPNPTWFIGGFDGSIEFFDGRIGDVQVYDGSLSAAQIQTLSTSDCATLGSGPMPIGTNYCGPAALNSSGAPAVMAAIGSTAVGQASARLECSSMPGPVFAFFLASRSQGFAMNPGGSAGNLCLGGAIGRYVGPGEIQNSGQTGMVALDLDLSAIPQPNGPASVMPGETWNFQCWFRDSSMGMATSNFSDGLSIQF